MRTLFFNSTRLQASLVPMMVVVLALLGAVAMSDPPTCDFDSPATSMVVGLPTMKSVAVQPTATLISIPTPRAGRLRVREADRLGPARLYLPPPAV